MCVCGAQHVLAGDMLPNNTVRDTINRILEANNSGGDNKDTKSAFPKAKILYRILSVASKGKEVLPQIKDTTGPRYNRTGENCCCSATSSQKLEYSWVP
ncbi:hypothetical protein ACET3Z_004926 [Daucus carota]